MSDSIALGLDCNQNLLHDNASFAALSRIHVIIKYRGLEFNPACGHTWQARGESSTIDRLLYRWPMTETSFHLKDEWRLALPSDHTPFLGVFPAAWDSVIVRHDQGTHVVDGIQTCLLWRLSRRTLTVSFVKSHSSRFAETIHVDCRLGSTRAHLKSMNSYDNVRSARTFSRDVSSPNKFRRSGTRPRNNTNYMCYKKAREGDRWAISHLRRSASQSFSDGSFIERLGGQSAATKEMQAFYKQKYC